MPIFIIRVLNKAPRMFHHGLNSDSLLDVSIEHLSNQVDTVFTHDVRYSEIMVHDFIDAVERVLLVDDGVEQDAEGPDILFFAPVWETTKNFRCCIV